MLSFVNPLNAHCISYGERFDENKQQVSRLSCRRPIPGPQAGLSRTCSSATQARRGQPRGPDCACAGPFLRLRAGAGVMAASVASRGRALLRAGSACLRQGSIGELLRARMEGGTPGRDFSLSHYRVRAGWGLGTD